MAGMDWINNIYIWMGGTFLFLILFILLFILLIFLAKKTHAIIEFKALLKGHPICQFYEDSGYVQWKAVKPEAGIIQDKNYGTYIIISPVSALVEIEVSLLLSFCAGKDEPKDEPNPSWVPGAPKDTGVPDIERSPRPKSSLPLGFSAISYPQTITSGISSSVSDVP